MASLAHLSREERIGLGIAAAAHVALVAALVLQVRDEPTALPIPERMDVSLADEVSLTSTAPDPSAEPQAAAAPVLSDVPEPVVLPEPRPVVRPTPAPRPTTSPRPTPTPSARPAPRPSRTSQGGSQRFEDAFREGSPSPRATGTTDSQPARTFGAAERASLAQAVNRQLRPHWNAPQGVDVEKLVTVVTWDLNPDGSLKGRPRVVRTTGVTDSNRPQVDLYGERAVRAVQLAAPFDLPEEYYEHWDRLTWEFDRNLSR